MSDHTSKQTPPGWLARLAELDQRLRTARLPHSPDRWINLHDLILLRLDRQDLPEDPEALRRLFQPLLVSAPDEQERFARIFADWWAQLAATEKPAKRNGKRTGKRDEPPQPRPVPKTIPPAVPRRWPTLLLALGLTLLGGLAHYWSQKPSPLPPPPSVPLPIQQLTPDNGTKEVVPVFLPLEPLPPVRIPFDETVPLLPDFQRQLESIGVTLRLIAPIMLALVILLINYLGRRLALRRRKGDPKDPLKAIYLAAGSDDLFNSPELRNALRRLHQPEYQATRQLHTDRTVQATVAHAGLFQPIWRDRALTPELLIWSHLPGASHPAAGLAATLVKRLRQTDLLVHSYHSYGDARRLYNTDRKQWQSLETVLGRHQQARLLLVGDGEQFIDPWNGQLYPWLQQLEAWSGRTLLLHGHHPEAPRQLLRQTGLQLVPFTSSGLLDLFGDQRITQLRGSGKDQSVRWSRLPRLLRETSRYQTSITPPSAAIDELMQTLRGDLGPEGMQLLAAMAVYPRLHWGLGRALDASLFESDDAARRERRLLRIYRLPWFRDGWLPDWLRWELLRKTPDRQRREAERSYRQIFDRLINQGQAGVVLPFHISKGGAGALRRWVRNLLPGEKAHAATRDLLFAGFVFGGLRSRLAFLLPRPVSRLLLGSTLLGSGSLLAFSVLLGGLLVFGADGLWQAVGQQAVQQWLADRQRGLFASQPVQVEADNATSELARELVKQLGSDGFARVTLGLPENPDPTQAADVRSTPIKGSPAPPVPQARFPAAKLIHASGNREQADFIRQRLERIGYDLLPITQIIGQGGIRVELHTLEGIPANSPRLRDGFGQEPLNTRRWAEIEQKLRAGEPIALIDRLPGQQQTWTEPVTGMEFVLIPRGCYDMGSPAGVGDSDERPQHKVCIESFWMSRTEVTQAQWQLVMDDNPARFKGDDRPVESVSWNSVQDFVKKLSAQSGRELRLPSESEWEYAARAGTTTAYSWGDAVGQNNANCDGCGSQWDNQETAPVGSFAPNPFGLSDMHGNVWEWTLDCWHESYDGAPEDGKSWLEDGKDDCARRVLRGGSWFNSPEFLRSAFRFWINTGDANYLVGFRLARTF